MLAVLAADQPRNAASCAAVHGCISGARACLAVGGEAVAAGLRASRWCFTAAPSAADRIVWT